MQIAQDLFIITFVRVPEWIKNHFKAALFIGFIVIVFVGIGMWNSSKPQTKPIPAYQSNAPQTQFVALPNQPGRIYYVNAVQQSKTLLTLTDYWDYDTKWTHKTQPLPLKISDYRIVKR